MCICARGVELEIFLDIVSLVFWKDSRDALIPHLFQGLSRNFDPYLYKTENAFNHEQ